MKYIVESIAELNSIWGLEISFDLLLYSCMAGTICYNQLIFLDHQDSLIKRKSVCICLLRVVIDMCFFHTGKNHCFFANLVYKKSVFEADVIT